LDHVSERLRRLIPFTVLRQAPSDDERLLGLRQSGFQARVLEGQSVTPGRGPGERVDSRLLVLHVLLPRAEVVVACTASAAAYPKVAEDFRILLRSVTSRP